MKITKAPKKLAEATPQVKDLLDKISQATDDQLPGVLDNVLEWCWPRGDLHYWTQTLNRFDIILSDTIQEYGIDKVQTKPFEPARKDLIASILRFSRMLIENCTNRKLYNSYDRLNDLLMAQDGDILEATLRLLLRPAQQYSSQAGGKSELPVSLSRLATLALTWPPKDHTHGMATMIQPDAQIPEEMLGLRFQFYQEAESSIPAAATKPERTQTNADAGPSRTLDSTPVRSSLSSRREAGGRPTPQSAASATGGLSLGQSPDPRRTAPGTNTEKSSSHASARDSVFREGLRTVRIKNVLETGKQPTQIFSDVVEEYNVPSEDRFDLYQKIRVAASLPNYKARRQLLICRLFALACYCHLVSESAANSQLFLYEPDIVQKTAAFVEDTSRRDQMAQAAGFYALDGLARFGSKLSDVLSSVSASVNHGILLRTLRLAIDDLSTRPEDVSEPLVDSVFGFIAFITSTHVSATQSGSSMVVGAGLVPLLVQLVNSCQSKLYMAQRTVCRAIGLLDSVLYSHPPSLPWFTEARGLDACVNRVAGEVEADLQDADAQMSEDTLSAYSDEDPLYGKLTYGRASLLRNLFKSIHHLMQAPGTTDAVRGLIDSSLLASVQQVLKNRRTFGPQILGQCISIVAAFIHNEPTSLSALQEKKLPELCFDLVEADVEAHADVITAFPNVIGAICLNEAGLTLFNERSGKILPTLFSIFTSKRHLAVLQDRDNAAIFGSAIDELIRHQPSMKQKVMETVLQVLDNINRIGQTYQPGPSDGGNVRAQLQLVPELLAGADETSALPVRSVALGDVVLDEVSGHRRGEQKSTESENDVMAFMDVTLRFLDGFFQSSSHCKEFLKSDGPDKLLRFLSLPCLPYNFPSSNTADSLVSLLRYMAEISPGTLVGVLLKEIKRGMRDAENIWSQDANVSSFQAMLSPSNDAALESANQRYRVLINLNALLYIYANVLPTFGLSSAKLPVAFLQILQNGSTSSTSQQATLSDFGHLLRTTSWENVLLKATAPPLPKPQPKEGQATPAPQPGFPQNLLEDNAGTVEQQESAITDSIMRDQQADPCLRNSIGLRYLMLHMPSSLASVFHQTTRLVAPRKSSDPSSRRLAAQVSTNLADALVHQLMWQDSQNVSNSFAFATMMIGHVTNVLMDERSSVHANTGVLVPFERAGGIAAIVDVFNRYVDDFEANQGSNQLDAQEASLRLGHICGGLKVALNPMQNLCAAQVILESPATQHLANKDTNTDPIKPYELLLRLRLAIMPSIRNTWMKDCLHKLPLSVSKSVMQTLLHILQAQGEDPPKPRSDNASESRGPLAGVDALLSSLQGGVGGSSSSTAPRPAGSGATVRRPNVTADENRVQHIVEMGFPRRAARHALTRYSNNTNAAAEYLLAHPEIVMSMANEPDNPPAQTSGQGSAAQPAGSSTASNEEQTPETQGPAAPSSNENAMASEVAIPAAAVTSTPEDQAVPASAADNGDVAMHDASGTPSTGDQKSEEQSSKERKTPEISPLKVELDKAREGLSATVTKRGLELADHHDALVFDVRDSILIYASDADETSRTLKSLIEEVHALVTSGAVSSVEVQNKIAVRLHLLALVLNEETVFSKLGSDFGRMTCNAIGGLASSYDQNAAQDSHAKWLAPLFLVAFATLSRHEQPKEVSAPVGERQTPPPESKSVKLDHPLEAEAHAFFDLCMRCLATANKLTHEEFLALYRLLVLLTRDPHMAKSVLQRDGILSLMRPFWKQFSKAQGCQVYLMIILRHVVEAQGLLRTMMLQEVRAWFAKSRTPSAEAGMVVRGLTQVGLRDPDMFLDIMKSETKIADYDDAKGSCFLKLKDSKQHEVAQTVNLALTEDSFEGPPSPTKRTTAQEGDALMGDSAIDRDQDPQQRPNTSGRSDVDGVIHLLLSELFSTLRERSSVWARRDTPRHHEEGTYTTAADKPGAPTIPSAEDANSGGTGQREPESVDKQSSKSTTSEQDDALGSSFFYICLVMQCLTELTSSYIDCKTSFINCSKKRLASIVSGKDGAGTPKAKSVPGIMTLFLSELAPMAFTENIEDTVEARRRATISNCAMSTIVGLSADVCYRESIKDVAPDLISTRKQLLDALSRALKDAAISSEIIAVRYGRIYALAELCNRLLVANPSNSGAAGREDVTLHMAKTMLEKNFVTVLTGALGDLDLNLPTVKALVDAILRPLDHLTRIATRTQSKMEQNQGLADASSDSEMESMSADEAGMGSDREDTPDFYRSSALGMHTGEMGDPDDSMDEDEDEMDEDEMGEYEDDDRSDRSDLTDESEEDDEDMDEHLEDALGGHEMDEDSSDDSDDGLDQMNDGQGDDGEDDWTDDETSGSEEDDEDDEDGLDFIIGESEDLPGADEGALGGMEDMYADDGGQGFEMLEYGDEDAGEYDSRELSEEEDEVVIPSTGAPVQAFDRYGANWGWTQPGDGGSNRGVQSGPLVLPPSFFSSSRAAGEPNGGGRSGAQRYSLQPSMLAGSGEEDPATHPLLVDQQPTTHASQSANRRNRRGVGGGYADWASSIEDLVGESAMNFFEAIFGRQTGQGDAPRLHFSALGPNALSGLEGFGALDGSSGRRLMPLSNRQAPRSSQAPTDPIDAVRAFSPAPSTSRLQDEQRIVFGELANDRATRLRNHIIWPLLRAYEGTNNTERDELAQITGERDRILAELNNMRTRLQQHQGEVDSLQNLLAQHREARSPGSNRQQALPGPSRSNEDIEMSEPRASNSSAPRIELDSLHQGLQELDRSSSSSQSNANTRTTQPTVEPAAESSVTDNTPDAPADAPARNMFTLNGRQVDITDFGIDLEFLDALPEYMQEEVVSQTMRERAATATASEVNSNINPEFLDALPPEMRTEVLEQEAASRALRRREEGASSPAPEGGEDPAEDGEVAVADADDNGDATRPSVGNQAGTQDGIPADFAGDLRRHIANSHRRFDGQGRSDATNARRTDTGGARENQAQRDSIQLLDGNGIAAIIRLLYFPGLSNSQRSLHRVLANLARNAKTRVDILNILLKVLADGCADNHAVEKSFANVSARAQAGTPGRTPLLKRSTSTSTLGPQVGSTALAPLSRTGEDAAHLIASRSIETLLYLTNANHQSALYFLQADTRQSKKAKGKDKERSASAPVNTLLSLLERPSILGNAQVTSTLIGLLNAVTKHIGTVTAQIEKERAAAQKAKEAEDGKKSSTLDDSSEGQDEQEQQQRLHVSAENLAAVVRPLGTAISSRGFQNTLAVAAHLASIDAESREAVTNALQREVAAATAILSQDLDSLLATLPAVQPEEEEDESHQQQQQQQQQQQSSEPGAGATAPKMPQDPVSKRIQSSALPELASPASAQARLLRSLRAIEWLHGGR